MRTKESADGFAAELRKQVDQTFSDVVTWRLRLARARNVVVSTARVCVKRSRPSARSASCEACDSLAAPHAAMLAIGWLGRPHLNAQAELHYLEAAFAYLVEHAENQPDVTQDLLSAFAVYEGARMPELTRM